MIGALPKTDAEIAAAHASADPALKLGIYPVDARTAECGNRRQCVLAHSADRQLGLRGSGHIIVDACQLAYSHKGFRYIYHMTQKARDYLIRFDKLGEEHGLDHARVALVDELTLKPKRFTFPLVGVRPVPVITRARQDQVNAARNEKKAVDRAKGRVALKPAKRYVGV